MSEKFEMAQLIRQLNEATKQYDLGAPIMTDQEWDELYFHLQELERTSGITLTGSPTQNIHYQVVNKLEKVEHNHPMLSLDKTKEIDSIKSFVNGHQYIIMAKADGLTCSLLYKNGILQRAETRGNGVVGEDITHNAWVIESIPKYIGTNEETFIVDGELVCLDEDFQHFKDEYKNSRNFTSGSARLLDSHECKKRHLTFIAWDVIEGFEGFDTLSSKLNRLSGFFGFETIPRFIGDGPDSIESQIEEIKNHCKTIGLPIDGVVFKFNYIDEYEAAGRTNHHFKGGLAYKFYDETYPTRLKAIRWTMGRTGVLTPVAIFDPIEIDGTIVEKASLHNVGIMRDLLGECAYVGEPLEIYKANQIIPQVASAGPKHNYGEVIAAGGVSAHDVITKCPICGHDVVYKDDFVYCDNPQCDGKLINKLDHFCGKKGLDIKGLSKKTLEKLIDWEWVSCIEDIFLLKNHRAEWIKKTGFGEKSVDKVLNAIEESRKTTLAKFIAAIGIHNISTTASILLADYFYTWYEFREAMYSGFDFTKLPHFGTIADYDINNFDYTEADKIAKDYIIWDQHKTEAADTTDPLDTALKDITFVITGKLNYYKNRDELVKVITSHGGKVAGSVSTKTKYLINNDTDSNTQKNQKAKSLNIPIISEDEFIALIQS